MKLSTYIGLVLLVPLLLSCQKEVSPISASSRWQISTDPIVDGKLSDNGKFAALLLSNKRLELWNNSAQRKVSLWQNEQLVADSYLLALSESAEYILSASHNTIQIWHTEAEESIGTLNLSAHLGDARITQIRFWMSPYRVLIGTSSGDVIFADTQNNSYRVNRSHSGEVVKLELSNDQNFLFSGGNDGLVIKWDLINYRPLVTKKLPFRITSLAVGLNDNLFVSDALKDHIIWNSEQDIVINEVTYFKRFQWFREALFDPQLRWLVTSSPKTDMYLWNLNDMSILGSWMVESQSFGSTVEDLVLLEANTLRTLTSDGVIQDWDLSTLSPDKL